MPPTGPGRSPSDQRSDDAAVEDPSATQRQLVVMVVRTRPASSGHAGLPSLGDAAPLVGAPESPTTGIRRWLELVIMSVQLRLNECYRTPTHKCCRSFGVAVDRVL